MCVLTELNEIDSQANEAFHELLLNWIAFVKPYNIPFIVSYATCLFLFSYCLARSVYTGFPLQCSKTRCGHQVGALDDKIMERCEAAGVPAVPLQVRCTFPFDLCTIFLHLILPHFFYSTLVSILP